jgi:hypothetical protein
MLIGSMACLMARWQKMLGGQKKKREKNCAIYILFMFTIYYLLFTIQIILSPHAGVRENSPSLVRPLLPPFALLASTASTLWHTEHKIYALLSIYICLTSAGGGSPRSLALEATRNN